ncbi:MAG TPA: hypothetical protein VFA71_05210 [Terriglobales bacterium]|nr:hypothetical protein [Terriglobales bacterium]
MDRFFNVGDLSVERLLTDWRWLCPEPVTLVARNAFGDLFLRVESGKVFKLDISTGQRMELAESEEKFRVLAATEEKRQQWFAEQDELAAAKQGLRPNAYQCIGFKTPLVFAESGTPGNAYVADLYEHVSFLGDLHRQISKLPEGAKVKLAVKK